MFLALSFNVSKKKYSKHLFSAVMFFNSISKTNVITTANAKWNVGGIISDFANINTKSYKTTAPARTTATEYSVGFLVNKRFAPSQSFLYEATNPHAAN